MRNEEETRALQESGAALSRARFDSMPNPEEFRGRLKNQLLEKRQLKRTSMWTRIKNGLGSLVPTKKTFVFGMVVVLLVAVVTTMLVNRPGGITPQSQFAELLIDRAYAKNNFEITPTQGDSLAVDNTTEFVIKSKTNITKDALEKSIRLSPETPFVLTEVSPNEFRLSPQNPLEQKQVYTVEIDAAYTDENNVKVERDFSFAFQVKNQFKVLYSVPGTQAQGVPVNTGIEFTFSSENFSDYEKNFTIEPKVEGKFEVRGRILTFVPKKLNPSTVYTVTLNKNIKVEGTEPMNENFVIQFETEPVQKQYSESYWYMNSEKVEFAPGTTMSFPLSGNSFESEFTIKAFAFRSFDVYKKNYLKSLEIPSWARETSKQFSVPASDLQLTREFSLKPQNYKSEYNKYLVLPESLPKGSYWLEISAQEQIHHMFVEVTDIASYTNITTGKSLVWVNSLSTKGALSGAKVALASGKNLGQTGVDGTVTFDTNLLNLQAEELLQKDGTYRGYRAYTPPEVLELSQGTDYSLMPLNVSSYSVSYAYSKFDDYIINFSSDRSLYLPTDTIQFWGYITNSDKTRTTETFTIGIPNTNNYFYGRNLGNLGFLSSVNVIPDEQGFFRGEIKINNLTAGGYNLVLNQGDTQLQSRYLEVSAYVKPNYTLSVEADKNAVFVGEKINFKTDVEFFEGTPVPNYDLSYSDSGYGYYAGFVKTDKNGEARFDLTAKLGNDCDFVLDVNCYFSFDQARYQNLNISSLSTEESPLNIYTGFSVYPAKIDGIIDAHLTDKTHAIVSSTWYDVDLSVLNDKDYTNDDKVFDSPAKGKKVTGVILETRWEKRETGQYYDFINKKTEKTYSYDPVTTTTVRFSGETDSKGHFEYPFTISPSRSYQVRLKVEDGQGSSLYTSAYVYGLYYNQSNAEYTWYSLHDVSKKDDPEKMSYGYKVGDTVRMALYKNDSPIENTTGSLLFTELQQGLKKYKIQNSPEYTFTFAEENIPNVYIGAVYFDGTKYIEPAEGDYRSSVRFDTRERELKVEIESNKKEYKPGEKINLEVKTTDKNGKAHPARINISVIDEAFLALGSYGSGRYHAFAASNPLSNLYQDVQAGTIFSYRSHKFADINMFGGAEGGGCFLPGTKITLANGKTKNIEDIQVGDVILTFKNEVDNTLVPGTVKKLQTHTVSEYLIVNNKIRVTPEHRVLVNGQWTTAGEMKVGDFLRGENGEPVEVLSVEHQYGLVKVYNFEVENYHTYIAEGIYVHNDKGGGSTRSYFPDVAFYGFVETNNSGKGSVSFTLPDSVTSWRVTGEAISNDFYGGIGDANVDVSLPVFGLFSVPKDLLRGDKPSPVALAYGKNLQSKDEVELSVSGDLFVATTTKKSVAFERNIVPATKSADKSGSVKLQLQSKKGNDALLHKFSVVESRVQEQAQILLAAANGPIDLGDAKNATTPVQLRFAESGQGSLYFRMYPFIWSGGSRLDQKVGSVVAKDWFKDFFSEEELSTPADLTPYMSSEGFKLLPYGGADLELSSKVASVLKDSNAFDKERMGTIFISQLYNTIATEGELSTALWGAAAVGEPVIPSIRTLAEKAKQPRTKIFLALAATELGDNEYARTLYEDLLKEVDETDTFAKVTITDEPVQMMENTALMSVVAARLQDPRADKFDRFVQMERKQNVYDLEELLFIREKLKQLSSVPAKANLMIDGQKYPIDLSSHFEMSLTVLPEQFDSLSLSDVEGQISLLVSYDNDVEGIQSTNRVSLTRKYFVDGKETTSFKEGDKVEVRLYPTFGKDAPPGSYVIVDSLPSGLKLTSAVDLFSPWTSSWCPGGYPFEVNGQTIKFMVDRDFQKIPKDSQIYDYYGYCHKKDYISYQTRISTLGEFRKEGALIQSVESKDVKNLSSDTGMIKITE